MSKINDAEVFISYASRNHNEVVKVVEILESTGVKVWRDKNEIMGGGNYGLDIVRGIKNSKVLMLMCTDASMRSKNVKQEIQLAWEYDVPYLPILLESINFPEQVTCWLTGCQWIEVIEQPPDKWLTQIIRSLEHSGVNCRLKSPVQDEPETIIKPKKLQKGLKGLRSLGGFTDQIWPMPADCAKRDLGVGAMQQIVRGLGASQDDVKHGYSLGSRVSLALESDREGYLMLLDEGPEGITYCLCPSWFAPDTRLKEGRTYLPQAGSRYDSFVITGKPGKEHIMAIIIDEPLGLEWLPTEANTPARVLTPADIDMLLTLLRNLEPNTWTALCTYFEVTV